MNFKLVSRNNVGLVTVLLLVILLSQTKIFNFLVDTALGRAALIFLLIVISYANKILGVVSVLLIIIMFNNSDIGYLEGFTKPTNAIHTTNATAPASPLVPKPIVHTTKTKKQIAKATEGFDIIGKERNIQKGRQSNSIPVSDFMKESVSVAPYEGSGTESFAAY